MGNTIGDATGAWRGLDEPGRARVLRDLADRAATYRGLGVPSVANLFDAALAALAALAPSNEIVTAEMLWRNHRAALGGRSAITGQELPRALADCPQAVRAAHWAMALASAMAHGTPSPPAPEGISPDEQERIRRGIDIPRMVD